MKVNVGEQGDQFVLKAAVLLYQQSRYGHFGERMGMATVHTVCNDGDRPVIEAGRPMTMADYSAMIEVLSPKSRPQMAWQDPSVLAKGMGRMIWWTPPMMRPMFFKESAMSKGTFAGQGMCPLPGMVWHTTGRALYVYAVKGHDRPEPETELFQAPLFNIWARGEVCHGNVVAPREEHSENPKEWEKFLFGSHFTHPNFGQKDRLIKGVNPVEFWKKMVQQPKVKFPEERLVEIGLKVQDLMAPDFSNKVGRMKATGEF